jgi:hypothetical protein
VVGVIVNDREIEERFERIEKNKEDVVDISVVLQG